MKVFIGHIIIKILLLKVTAFMPNICSWQRDGSELFYIFKKRPSGFVHDQLYVVIVCPEKMGSSAVAMEVVCITGQTTSRLFLQFSLFKDDAKDPNLRCACADVQFLKS